MMGGLKGSYSAKRSYVTRFNQSQYRYCRMVLLKFKHRDQFFTSVKKGKKPSKCLNTGGKESLTEYWLNYRPPAFGPGAIICRDTSPPVSRPAPRYGVWLKSSESSFSLHESSCQTPQPRASIILTSYFLKFIRYVTFPSEMNNEFISISI